MNQYIYFSSKGNRSSNDTANSDFSVNFSNPIVIPPYAELRCVSCRVNPNNNTYAVKEGENDRLAFAVGKFWIPDAWKSGDLGEEETYSNSFPIFSIKLDEGVYDLSSGTDPNFYLNAQIEEKINEQITNIPNIRGGVSVGVDTNKILTIKVSPMGANGYYGIPDGVTLPNTLLDKLRTINSRTTSIKASYYGKNPEYLFKRVELAPFSISSQTATDDLVSPNQVGTYDVTCGTLVGTFNINDIVNITTNLTLFAKVLAVNANLPTKIEIFNTGDDWKTDSVAPDVSIQIGANTCKITAYTSTGPEWRGVTLNTQKVEFTNAFVLQRCGYFLSPAINWNSLGDFETSSARQYKLASIFTIDFNDYTPGPVRKTTFRGVYSCFTDSLKGVDCGISSAGLGAGCFSGAVAPYSYLDSGGNPIDFEPPEVNGDDKLTDVLPEDESELDSYLFRVEFDFTNENGILNVHLKTKEGDTSGETWGWNNYVNGITGNEPSDITIDDTDILSIETYVAPFTDINAQAMQIVIKIQDGGVWETKMSVEGVFPNYLGFHKLCNNKAMSSKVGQPANIRFSYAHNAPNSSLLAVNNNNYTMPGDIFWAGAYNPVDEADGFVNGAFRSANYITSQAKNLPTNLPVNIYGVDSLDETDRDVISSSNPNGGFVVPFDASGEARLLETGANAGSILGLDEQGWQVINTNSFTNGIVFESDVNLNSRDFPQFYLDLPDLPIKNHTGVCDGTGRPNNFICPLDLGNSGENALHTSQSETLLYNDLGNAMEERLTNLRIRICDMEGTPCINLDNYTVGCLEIRENPQMKQAKMHRALKREEEESLSYQSGVRPTQFNRVQ